MFAYLTALDLTREAARFASVRDYHELNPATTCIPAAFVADAASACNDNVLHYYYDAACFFTDTDLNPFLEFNSAKYDDLVITVFTVTGNDVTDRHPDSGYWSLYNDNWQKDCQGNVVTTTSFFTDAVLESYFVSRRSHRTRGGYYRGLRLLRHDHEPAVHLRTLFRRLSESTPIPSCPHRRPSRRQLQFLLLKGMRQR